MVWTWAAATRIGTSHIRAGTRGQDAHACLLVGDTFCVIASDGAGSAAFGGQGANLVCRVLSQQARAHFGASAAMPDDAAVWGWLDDLRDRIGQAATARALDPRDFAATMVAAFCSPSRCLVAHIGDGAAVVKDPEGWKAASWPESGEYASTTFFVTDAPQPRLRLTRLESAISEFAVFTDGIERLVLDLRERRPHTPFFEGMLAPLRAADVPGRDRRLSAALAAYLDGDAVNARTDDDKTLILACRR